ncbi:hypothetical protein J6590_087373 [Homalodisca vitripennis]|nr:hypothetical protein J6590_087373 [Homalodisca vitripennis]
MAGVCDSVTTGFSHYEGQGEAPSDKLYTSVTLRPHKKSQIRSVECNHYLKCNEDQGQDHDLQMNSSLREQAFRNRRPVFCSVVVLPFIVRGYW